MNNAKHTPGPWVYRDNGIYSVTARPDWADPAIDPDYAEERIQVVDLFGAMGGESEADARLIEKAPEMAGLLRDLVKFTTAMHVGAHNPADAIRMHHAARALLAHIDGEAR